MSEELIAYLADQRVGRLIRKDNGNLQFRYDAGYGGPPLSHALPVQDEAHPHAVCHAVFGGLLPEGDGREALARALGVSPGNDYGLLAEVGGDCAGAITLLPPDVALEAEPHTRALDDEQLDAVLRALPQRPLGVNPEQGVRLSLAGAQPKLRNVTAVPALELPRLWEALVFNWLIGNCDAHGKNFSLLYDRGAPTLAPLYDLVSTTAYPELTTRLAMRIDGATSLEEVGSDAWVRLAEEIGVSERFARRTTEVVVERVSMALRAYEELEQPLAGGIARRILAFRG